MDTHMLLILMGCACVAALTIFLAWTTRAGVIRLVGLVLMIGTVTFTILSSLEATGRPKLIAIETLKASKAVVLAAQGVENVAIYIWMQLPGTLEPRYYVLPWSQDVAQELKKAMDALKPGEQLMMTNPFERTWDKKEPKFYPLPQPKMPDKPESAKPDQGFSYKQQAI